MFTGIIESTGIVRELLPNGSNLSFVIESALTTGLKVDQSISHNGVCLTVEEITGSQYKVTAIEETLKKTNLSSLQKDSIVNLEQCLQFNGRIDGHLVQGHVDTTAMCSKRKEKKGSWEFEFEFAEKFSSLIIEKGSVCMNGISLTAFNVKKKKFSVAIIPYTLEHTNIKELKKGDRVNLEFDVIGKYLLQYIKNMEK
jgi:riboflavin synthase